MQLQTLLVLAAAAMATAHQGFTIPEGQPEGVYSVEVDDTGVANHTLIAAPSSGRIRRSVPSAKLRARDGSVTCGSLRGLNTGDTDAANADLFNQCTPQAQLVTGHNFYSIRGGTVAFVCNFGGDNFCDGGTVTSSDAAITNVCGSYNAGWIEYTKISYGYDGAGSNFCGTGP